MKAEKNPNLKFRNPSVCSCVGYTENQIFDLLQDEFQKNLPIIIISQCVLCSIQNSKPGRVVVNFKRFLNFFREIKSIYFTKNSNCPLLATSRGRCLLATSKKFKIQQFAHTKSKKSAKLLLLQYSIPRWFGYL